MLNPMRPVLRSVHSLMSPSGKSGRLSILIFHRVLAKHDPLSDSDPVLSEFEMQMEWVSKLFNVVPLYEGVMRLQDGSLPARAASITFDDGFADNLQVALPVLQRFDLHATFFVSTGYLGGGIMFNDLFVSALRDTEKDVLDLGFLDLGMVEMSTLEHRKKAFYLLLDALRYQSVSDRLNLAAKVAEEAEVTPPTDLMLDESGVKALHDAGMEIGGHTVTHPILAALGEEEARKEILDGKDQLESIISVPLRLFAYPNGRPGADYSPRDSELVRKAGFDAAVSTQPGAARRSTLAENRFQLPRFTPWDMSENRFAVRMIRNLLITDRKVA